MNSKKRLMHFAARGVDTVDGTYLTFRGLDRGLMDIAGWLDAAAHAETNFTSEAPPANRVLPLRPRPEPTIVLPAVHRRPA